MQTYIWLINVDLRFKYYYDLIIKIGLDVENANLAALIKEMADI